MFNDLQLSTPLALALILRFSPAGGRATDFPPADGDDGLGIAQAHITIAPNQSMAGATEKYVLRVPTEGKVATVAAEIDIPEGVVVEAVGMPGVKYEANAMPTTASPTWCGR